jgi:hypothetical protein
VQIHVHQTHAVASPGERHGKISRDAAFADAALAAHDDNFGMYPLQSLPDCFRLRRMLCFARCHSGFSATV